MNPTKRGRYPGARPFADDPNDQKLFFGRDQEIDQLFHRIAASRLLVLFGKSGLGKTSLLQAGVYPRLRDRDMLPIPVRLNSPERPLDAIKTAVTALSEQFQLDYTPGIGESLWEYFKTLQLWQGERLLTPVLVIDQFEEIFTLKTPAERQDWASQLGDLLRETLPLALRKTSTLSASLPAVRLVFSLREDFLGALQELADLIPGIFDDRMRLSPLTDSQAESAIGLPASVNQPDIYSTPPFSYEPTTLNTIIQFLRGKSAAIEPCQLQWVCCAIEAQVWASSRWASGRHKLPNKRRKRLKRHWNIGLMALASPCVFLFVRIIKAQARKTLAHHLRMPAMKTLTTDTATVVLKSLKETGLAVVAMQQLLISDEPDPEYASTLLGLIELTMADVSERIGIPTETQADVHERFVAIKAANSRIGELERQLGNAAQITPVIFGIKLLEEKLRYWWKTQGFGQTTLFSIDSYGAKVTLSGTLSGDFSSMLSDTPVSDKENKARWLNSLADKGYALSNQKGDANLMDCDKNRELIVLLIRGQFPSARIRGISNFCRPTGVFQISAIEITIRDLNDIDGLASPDSEKDIARLLPTGLRHEPFCGTTRESYLPTPSPKP